MRNRPDAFAATITSPASATRPVKYALTGSELPVARRRNSAPSTVIVSFGGATPGPRITRQRPSMNSRSYTSASPSPFPVIRQRIVQFMVLAAR